MDKKELIKFIMWVGDCYGMENFNRAKQCVEEYFDVLSRPEKCVDCGVDWDGKKCNNCGLDLTVLDEV